MAVNPVAAAFFRGRGMPPGGAPGQVLAKASDADFDYVWVDAGSGGPVSWGSITNKPTTLAGYGIEDAATAAQGALAASAVQPPALAAGLATKADAAAVSASLVAVDEALAGKADAAATSAALAAVNERLVGFDRIEAVTEYPVPEVAGVLYFLVGGP